MSLELEGFDLSSAELRVCGQDRSGLSKYPNIAHNGGRG
jgi:hypothetical protein